MRIGAVLIALLACAGAARADDAALVAAATEEGSVTWYTTLLIGNGAQPISAAFEKKYPGIKVAFSRGDDESTTLKIITELRAHNLQDDVFDGFSDIAPLRQADSVAQYVPDTAALYSPALKDPQGYFTGLYMNIYVPALNTNLVPPDKFPKTYADLLDPRLRGKLVWNPTNSTAAPLFVGAVLRSMGEQQGGAYLKALAGQRIARLQLSARSILDQVIAGDFSMGLMMSAAHAADSIRHGAPVQWVRLDPTPAAVVVVGMLKAAPHPNAAKLFIDFLTGPEGQALIRDGGYIPALPAVQPLAREFSPTEGGFTATFLNGMDIAPDLDSWTRTVAQLFK